MSQVNNFLLSFSLHFELITMTIFIKFILVLFAHSFFNLLRIYYELSRIFSPVLCISHFLLTSSF